MASQQSLVYSQQSFNGGMDLFTERSRLDPNKYALLVNGRSRFGKVTPIKKCKKLTQGLPSAESNRYQGLYSAGSVAIVFAGGKAYVRDYSLADETFQPIADFQMSDGVDTIYVELVPASTINYVRAISDITKLQSQVDILGTLIAPSPVAAVVQDGISQPYVILSNGIARVTSNYDEWMNTIDGREYVPIGKQMAFVDGKLYIASPDGKQLYQSVSGRPLDFMVVIDQNGDKLNGVENGGAQNVSHRVFYDDITCLGKLPSGQGGFYVGSLRQSFIVIPDFTETIYGEPLFRNQYISNTGALNQFSFVGDVNGDSTFVDNSGVRSFNAILTEKNAGKNNPFSLLVSPLFRGTETNLQQSITAAGQFDNYTCYAVKTVYGNAVIWFDELQGVWDSIDLYSNVTGQIRQFTEILTPEGIRKLLCLTSDGGVYEMFGSENEVETCTFYYGDTCSQDTKVMQNIDSVNAIFVDSQNDGIIYATSYVDNQQQDSEPLEKNVTRNFTISNSISLPFGDASKNMSDNVMFDFNRSTSGWKCGVMLQWNFLASMTHISMVCSPVTSINNVKRSAEDLFRASQVLLNGV